MRAESRRRRIRLTSNPVSLARGLAKPSRLVDQVPFRRRARHSKVKVMRRPSRLIALSTSLLLASLVLVTSGFACGSASKESMSGMQMGGSASDAQHSTTTPTRPSPPCRFPWAPDGCQSMVPCAPAAVTSTALSLSGVGDYAVRVVTLVVITPPSGRPAPELPPPRA